MQEQQREKRALARAAECQELPVVGHLQRSQDSKIHCAAPLSDCLAVPRILARIDHRRSKRRTMMRPLLAAAGLCAALSLVLASASLAGQPVTQPLNPPPPSFETCKATGDGFVCQGAIA